MGGRATNNEKKFSRATVEEVYFMLSPLLNEFCSKHILCGSYRRNLQLIGDLDIVVVIDDKKINVPFYAQELKNKIINNPRRSIIEYPTVVGNIQIDFYLATENNFSAQVLTWTGSKEFNIKCRSAAKKLGYKLNQYGLFSGDKLISTDENDILNKIGMDKFSDPSLRK
jgi:DNA polymerase (family 10)